MANLRYAAYRAGLETLYFSGAHFALRPIFSGVGAIFTLHHVRPPRDAAFQPNRILEIEAEFLDQVIGRLRERKLDIVSLDEVWRRLTERDFGRRFVAFTFDDGYRDNLEYAWPVLKKHGVPYAIYIATSFPDRLGEIWWVALERVVAKSERMAVEVGGSTRFFNCPDVAAKRRTFDEIYWWLRTITDDAELRRVVRDLCKRYGVDPMAPCGELCMNWGEIGRMAEDPLCTIGAHTINHVFLTKIPESAARMEMKRSADVIEAALGKRPAHFAYPYGDLSAAASREYALAKDLGFKTAVTTRPGVLTRAHSERLTALPRISLNGNFQALRYVDVLLSGAPFALSRRADAA
jgi:peptidoglycan/xylan/chitin deacetylase (PgdA/CDA1 family)